MKSYQRCPLTHSKGPQRSQELDTPHTQMERRGGVGNPEAAWGLSSLLKCSDRLFAIGLIGFGWKLLSR